MKHLSNTAFLHYSAPPVVGGVEAVIFAQCETFIKHGYPATVITGRGDEHALPKGCRLIIIPEIDSAHEKVMEVNQELENGWVTPNFNVLMVRLKETLAPILSQFDNLIVHNVFTKHFNLPLTAALFQLVEKQVIHYFIVWGHDFSWTSSHSRPKLHPGYPWDLLRVYDSRMYYVVVSRQRQEELAALLNCSPEKIHIIPNGVDPAATLGLSEPIGTLANRLGYFHAGLTLLMPVRVTQAKNIEYAIQVTAGLKQQGMKPLLVITGPPDPHDPRSMEYFQSLVELRAACCVVDEVQFVYNSGMDGTALEMDAGQVGELYRLSDMVFMPSHREGFGMPVLEAGLAGIPIFCAPIPAALEVGGADVHLIAPESDPSETVRLICKWAQNDHVFQLKSRVRQNYTWDTIFQKLVRPLIEQSSEN